jgi:hypothetical protein
MPRKATLKAKPLENRQFIVRYKFASGPLSEEQKKRLIRNIKKHHYYYDYLSGKFRFSFMDSENCTEATYLWKGGAGNWNEAGERVPDLLAGVNYDDILPEGVTAKLVSNKEV